MIADEAWTIPLPSALTFEAAAPLMCAGTMMFSPERLTRLTRLVFIHLGATIYCALKAADLSAGQSVAIIGAGVRLWSPSAPTRPHLISSFQ